MKNISIILACLFFGVLVFSSCHEDEEINPKDLATWGYFEGTINGKAVSFENEGWEDRIEKKNCKEYIEGRYPRVKGSCIGINKLGELGKEDELGVAIMLMNPKVGARHIINHPSAYFYDYDYDGVLGRNSDQMYCLTPRPDKPVKVNITSVEYDEEGWPRIIEGEIDGVLYFRDQDSLTIKGKFGVK